MSVRMEGVVAGAERVRTLLLAPGLLQSQSHCSRLEEVSGSLVDALDTGEGGTEDALRCSHKPGQQR